MILNLDGTGNVYGTYIKCLMIRFLHWSIFVVLQDCRKIEASNCLYLKSYFLAINVTQLLCIFAFRYNLIGKFCAMFCVCLQIFLLHGHIMKKYIDTRSMYLLLPNLHNINIYYNDILCSLKTYLKCRKYT